MYCASQHCTFNLASILAKSKQGSSFCLTPIVTIQTDYFVPSRVHSVTPDEQITTGSMWDSNRWQMVFFITTVDIACQ